LWPDHPQLADTLLLAATELTSDTEIDQLLEALRATA